MGKRVLLITLLTLLLLPCLAAEEWLNQISFRNKTGTTIYYLFFSPGDSDYWGPDVLGSSTTFGAGEELVFFVSYPEESAQFDFMAIDADGNVYEEYEHEIVDGEEARIIINADQISDTVDIESFEDDLMALEIANRTGFEIYYLFVSPSDSDMYGIDFMDYETTLADEESLEVVLMRSEEHFFYDIMGVDLEDDSYSFQLELDPDLDAQYVEITLDDFD